VDEEIKTDLLLEGNDVLNLLLDEVLVLLLVISPLPNLARALRSP